MTSCNLLINHCCPSHPNSPRQAQKIMACPCKNPSLRASLGMQARGVQASKRRRNLRSALVEEAAVAIPDELDRRFRAYHSLVFRTAYRITGNAADAEDVLQTVFLRLLRRGTHSDGSENLENEESYLRRAAINAALDVVRARRAHRSVELCDLPAAPAHQVPSELRRELARALAELTPRTAEIFVLRFLEGFSNPEIARMLGVSQVLVAVMVHRTRQQLRKKLGAYLRS